MYRLTTMSVQNHPKFLALKMNNRHMKWCKWKRKKRFLKHSWTTSAQKVHSRIGSKIRKSSNVYMSVNSSHIKDVWLTNSREMIPLPCGRLSFIHHPSWNLLILQSFYLVYQWTRLDWNVVSLTSKSRKPTYATIWHCQDSRKWPRFAPQDPGSPLCLLMHTFTGWCWHSHITEGSQAYWRPHEVPQPW